MTANNQFNGNMQSLLVRVQTLITHGLPAIVKVEGLDFIHDNFDAQSFNKGSTLTKWQARKKPANIWRKRGRTVNKGTSQQLRATKAGAAYLRSANRALLVKRGHLRRMWDQETTAASGEVAFRNSLPYAIAHNEGARAGRGTGFLMPERREIGDSLALDKRILAKIDREMTRIFNS